MSSSTVHNVVAHEKLTSDVVCESTSKIAEWTGEIVRDESGKLLSLLQSRWGQSSVSSSPEQVSPSVVMSSSSVQNLVVPEKPQLDAVSGRSEQHTREQRQESYNKYLSCTVDDIPSYLDCGLTSNEWDYDRLLSFVKLHPYIAGQK